MADDNSQKRLIKFSSFDEMFAEIESLAQHGYNSKGNWNLAQTCGHIGNWMRYPVDGFPVPPLFVRPIFWLMKMTVAKSMKKRILTEGFKGGTPTAPQSVPQPDELGDREAIEALRKTVDRVRSHSGALHPSPIFGPMDMKMLERVTLLHAEHHVSYLHPNN